MVESEIAIVAGAATSCLAGLAVKFVMSVRDEWAEARKLCREIVACRNSDDVVAHLAPDDLDWDKLPDGRRRFWVKVVQHEIVSCLVDESAPVNPPDRHDAHDIIMHLNGMASYLRFGYNEAQAHRQTTRAILRMATVWYFAGGLFLIASILAPGLPDWRSVVFLAIPAAAAACGVLAGWAIGRRSEVVRRAVERKDHLTELTR